MVRSPNTLNYRVGLLSVAAGVVPCERSLPHMYTRRFALRCWLCCASADVVMRRVYGALLVAMLVVCRVCADSGRV